MENSEILLKFIEQRKVSCYKLSQSTGISESTFSKWKSNPTSKIDLSVVQKIAAYFGVSLSDILECNQPCATVSSLSPEEQDLLNNFNQLSEIDKTRVSERAETLAELAAERAAEQKKEHRTERIHAAQKCLPLNDTCEIRYYDRAASAGTGLFLDEAIAETLTVQNTPEAQQADYAIPVSGDSMEKEYHDGDIVLVKSCPCVRKGEVGIFLLDGSVYIKEYGEKCLISYNEDYPPINLSKYETAACLGRVLGIAEVI